MHQNHHGQWIRDMEDYSAGERQNFQRNPEPPKVVVEVTAEEKAAEEYAKHNFVGKNKHIEPRRLIADLHKA